MSNKYYLLTYIGYVSLSVYLVVIKLDCWALEVCALPSALLVKRVWDTDQYRLCYHQLLSCHCDTDTGCWCSCYWRRSSRHRPDRSRRSVLQHSSRVLHQSGGRWGILALYGWRLEWTLSTRSKQELYEDLMAGYCFLHEW